jgi:hypothetical protein
LLRLQLKIRAIRASTRFWASTRNRASRIVTIELGLTGELHLVFHDDLVDERLIQGTRDILRLFVQERLNPVFDATFSSFRNLSRDFAPFVAISSIFF